MAAHRSLLVGGLVHVSASGKMYAGKDTVGPRVLELLDVREPAHLYFANALKDEVDVAIRIVSEAGTIAEAVGRLETELSASGDVVARCIDILWPITRDGARPESRSRSSQIRDVLQLWGTNYRRDADVDYWVRIALREAVAAVADGKSAYFSDSRFPNEVSWCQKFGFYVPRLEVSFETQQTRAADRDHLVLDAHDPKLNHSSETALDDYVGFNIVIDNNHGDAELSSSVIVEHMRAGGFAARAAA